MALVRSLAGIVCEHLAGAKENWCGIGIFDTHGRLISPAIAELLAQALEQHSYTVSIVNHAL